MSAAVSLPVLQPPRTRADCAPGGDGVWSRRPCLRIACKHHLQGMATKGRRPSKSCTLDVADRGGATLEYVGGILRVGRERIRQIEARALAKLLDACAREGVRLELLIPGMRDRRG